VPPTEYLKDMPVRREQVYRHIELTHLGAEGEVKEGVIVKMHDTGVEVTLSQFQSPNFIKTKKQDKKEGDDEPTQVWQVNDALVNYAAVMHSLWPTNFAPLVIQKSLVDSRCSVLSYYIQLYGMYNRQEGQAFSCWLYLVFSISNDDIHYTR
jgi:hypothetical protein